MFIDNHLQNRSKLVRELRAEVVGPDPAVKKQSNLDSIDESDWNLPFCDENGEEILRDKADQRYGAGILFPVGVTEEAVLAEEDGKEASPDDGTDEIDLHETQPELSQNSDLDYDDLDSIAVSLANAFKPSALGLSFLSDLDSETEGYLIEVVNVTRISRNEIYEAHCGTYRRKSVEITRTDPERKNFESTIYIRSPLRGIERDYPGVLVSVDELRRAESVLKVAPDGDHGLELVVNSRRIKTLPENQRLVTVSLVNRRNEDFGNTTHRSVFQSGIRISSSSNATSIFPYPQRARGQASTTDGVSEEDINDLLYKRFKVFGIGHGCAADWDGHSPQSVSRIWSDVLPTYEMPALSADVTVSLDSGERKAIRASMRKLSRDQDGSDWLEDLDSIVSEYAKWIDQLRDDAAGYEVSSQEGKTSSLLIERCENCLDRIREGLSILRSASDKNGPIKQAFQMMNEAMLIAQYRKNTPERTPVGFERNVISWDIPYNAPDLSEERPGVGNWRAFQIAFILMSLKGVVEPESNDREIVDLIWFPTGGGKTEAYLGLSAFTIFYNRLTGRDTAGVDVLMRYTLRLLTTQQFQRAALLFCAMESMRDTHAELGKEPFRIGLWVGGASTPNKRETAVKQYKVLTSDPDKENPFVLIKCPWCGAKMGPHEHEKDDVRVLGYELQKDPAKTVIFKCQDKQCEFGSAGRLSAKKSRPLPICVIDEDLYDHPPSMLIGTVDKFAMMAWDPSIRKFFGIDSTGKHSGLPPSLVIQDELHLISGPLGTMVGAYETVIDTLCRENGRGNVGPKVVASTATISHATEQIKSLYDREKVCLFPPSGLDAEDSFFARVDKDDQGDLKPGRQYIGILGSSYGSMQTAQARVFGALLQGVPFLKEDAAYLDPWWTLLCFYNSIRELGGASSLFVSDIREYTRSLLRRKGQPYEAIRQLERVSELTSRIRSDSIPDELKKLERKLEDADKDAFSEKEHARRVLDACLASNIIEVGVDVDRLALIAIVGQPKTTAQYIQVSSRIGRDPRKPGLVCMLYGNGKPRDRSHYEIFRQYHQRIYSYVEPTSVTPFSAPASERSVHALLVSLVRQLSPLNEGASTPDPCPMDVDNNLETLCVDVILKRVKSIAPDEYDRVKSLLQSRINQWRAWEPSSYGNSYSIAENVTLLHGAGMSIPPEWDEQSWPTMTSMRNVDANCEGRITRYFHKTEGDIDEQ